MSKNHIFLQFDSLPEVDIGTPTVSVGPKGQRLGELCRESQTSTYQLVTINPAKQRSNMTIEEDLLDLMYRYINSSGGKLIDYQIEQASKKHIHFVCTKGGVRSNAELRKCIHKICGKYRVRHDRCCYIIEDDKPDAFLNYICKTR